MKKLLFLFLPLVFCLSCSYNNHFISDKSYRQIVSKRFEERKEFAKHRKDQLFSVFKKTSIEEKEALQFLYAYMPLCDLADYDGDFFLRQVKFSLKARETFSWGKMVPEEIFRYFVLPYRVNNENLDTARMVFYRELKDRIIDLPMMEAALEVNHWCHEKVNYAPSDSRTSSPLSTVKTSHGRCGEESTFTVTAMRAVGIPARQVYTPRWAHSDDNHAWVEVWVDGEWYYLGACEPEPKLNMGWFTEPARRAMLIHTKVFGNYTGDDEVTLKTENYTEINVLKNYADVKKQYVEVTDKTGKALKDVRVDFGLYNYAEFYPIASINTDENGISSLTTGYGDLMIWVSKDGEYAYKKIPVGEQDTVSLCLNQHNMLSGEENYINVPPAEKEPYPVDESLKKENDIRLASEDSIRFAYRKTFITEEEAYTLAEKQKLDKEQTWKYLKASEGNWREIKKFFESLTPERESDPFTILSLISEKDLCDTKAEILLAHLDVAYANFSESDYKSKDVFKNGVLNPRVKNENLLTYRRFLREKFKGLKGSSREEKVSEIKSWIVRNLQINEEDNYYNLPISPLGVYQLKITNKESRDIFFVALCRSLGIPSVLREGDYMPLFFNGTEWVEVFLDEKTINLQHQQQEDAYITFDTKAVKKDFAPVYYTHYTIARFVDGVFQTLDYEWGWGENQMPEKINLQAGQYRLITGIRDASGTVFVKIKYFKLEAGKTAKLKMEFREPEKTRKKIGAIDLNNHLMRDHQQYRLDALFAKNFAVLIWVEPGKEPTRHLMEEFTQSKDKYEKWAGTIAMIQSEEVPDKSLNPKFFKDTPANYKLYKDVDNHLLENVKKILGIQGKIILPLVLVLDNKGSIYMASRGYKIGIHEQVLSLVM